jgi:hypothetical protein
VQAEQLEREDPKPFDGLKRLCQFGGSMRLGLAAALAAVGFCLSGCATIFEGTSQEITVVTNPPGASCVFEREGKTVANILNTPAATTVRKTKYDITIKCDKPGFQQAQYLNHSGTSAAIAGNVAADILLTAGISSIVDSANGADNKYDSAVNITLVPLMSATPSSSPIPANSPPTPAPTPVPAATPAAAPAANS